MCDLADAAKLGVSSMIRERAMRGLSKHLSAIGAVLAILSPAAGAARAADAVVPLDHLPALSGGYFQIQSAAVGRPFHIYVRLPENYARAPNAVYPVVYLLDGDSLFPILAANHLFLHYDENLAEAVVVGVAYGGSGWR